MSTPSTPNHPSRRSFLAAPLAAAPAVLAQRNRRPNIIFLLTDDQRWDALGCMGNPIIRTPNVDAMAAGGVTFTNNFVTTSICMTSRATFFTGLYARTHGINDFATSFTEQQYAATYPLVMRGAGYQTGFVGKWGVGKKMPRDKFDYFAGFGGQGHYFPNRPDKGVHLTEVMGDQSLEFLKGAKPDQPFCLSVSFKAPHVQDEDPQQFLHSPETASLYKDTDIPAPKTADPRYIAMLPREIQRSEGRRRWAVRFGTPELYAESVPSYYRLITEIDTVVGRIRDQLRQMSADDNTIIVYTGDNGFYLSEHGLAGKWYMHEESIHTPLVVYDPRLNRSQRGKRRAEMALNIDIAPTLCSMAGVRAPNMQGRDLTPLVRDENPSWRNEWFYEHMFEHTWIPRTEGVRTESKKYTLYLDTQPQFEELFDLEADPLEERNLAGAKPAELAELQSRHQLWRRTLEGWNPAKSWKDPA
ncbi:MAG: sulfatase [bacterium]|nr:sulfatase [bacterium]